MTMADEQPVLLEVDRGIATITLNSPARRNALSQAVRTALAARLAEAEADRDVRAVVLTGAGTVFCAGADLKEVEAGVTGGPTIPELLTAVLELPKPVVARLNGPARAGGLGLVAACDLAVAPDDVTFSFTEVRIGVVPAMIAVVCRERMDPRTMTRYMLTGETFGAAEAAAGGLITTCCPREELEKVMDGLLAGLRAAEPAALARTKRLLAELDGMPRAEAFALAEQVSAEFFASPQAAEGRRAFFDKRPPSWAL